MTPYKNPLSETVLMRGHSVCFLLEISKPGHRGQSVVCLRQEPEARCGHILSFLLPLIQEGQ